MAFCYYSTLQVYLTPQNKHCLSHSPIHGNAINLWRNHLTNIPHDTWSNLRFSVFPKDTSIHQLYNSGIKSSNQRTPPIEPHCEFN